MVVLMEENQGVIETRSERYLEYTSLYVEAGNELQDEAVVITGKDITFALYSSTESYRYEDPNDPINHAIEKFQATHVYTESRFYRYDIDINYTFLFGSPIEPYRGFESEYNSGYLWSVNQSRFANISQWLEYPLEIDGEGVSHGDFALIEGGSTLKTHTIASVYRIVEFSDTPDLEGLFDTLAGGLDDDRVLCSSVAQCTEINRQDRVDTTWAVWVI